MMLSSFASSSACTCSCPTTSSPCACGCIGGGRGRCRCRRVLGVSCSSTCRFHLPTLCQKLFSLALKLLLPLPHLSGKHSRHDEGRGRETEGEGTRNRCTDESRR